MLPWWYITGSGSHTLRLSIARTCPSSAIRCCFVYTLSDSIASFVFPNNGSISRHHPFLLRLSSGRIRRSPRYYDGAKTPCALPSRFVFLHGPVPPDTLRFRISSRDLRCKARERPGCFGLAPAVIHTPVLSDGGYRASQVPGDTSCAYALLFDPGRALQLCRYRCSVLPLVGRNERPQR